MSLPTDPSTLAGLVVSGDRRALARALSIVEDRRPGDRELLTLCSGPAPGPPIVGISGAPGAGKSTLTDRLVAERRRSGASIAVLAVDPASPFTGGAILGDRIRMQEHAGDPGVFIRSASSRGHLGGLTAAAGRMLAVIGAAGFDEVIVETVGVGQSEVEVVDAADTTVVVLTPGWGDAVQANKAGLLEAADVFVVNKADRAGADETVRHLHQMLDLGGERRWRPPILSTVATTGGGIDELSEAVARHRRYLADSGEGEDRRRLRRRRQVHLALHEALVSRLGGETDTGDGLLGAVERGEIDPWTAAARLLPGG
jgi:LAO/AO transport system kinase